MRRDKTEREREKQTKLYLQPAQKIISERKREREREIGKNQQTNILKERELEEIWFGLCLPF